MSTGAVPYPIVPPLPEYEREQTKEDRHTRAGGTEHKELAPEQRAALATDDQVTKDQITGTEEIAKQKAAEAAVNDQMARATAEEATAHAKRLDAAMAASQKVIDAARARAAEKQARLDATPSPKFFRDGDTWGNAKRAIGASLGGIGDAMQIAAMVRTGHGVPTMNTAQDIIDRDLQQQKDHIMRLRDDVVMARTGINDAQEARKELLADVDLKAAAAFKRLEALGKARLASLGKKQPEIDQHQAILALRAAAAKRREDYVAPMFETVQKHWEDVSGAPTKETFRSPTAGKGPSESQAKTADLSAGMLSELKTIESLPPLSQDELAKVQNNELASNAADKATGLTGAIGAKLGRATGLIPRTKYEGLTPDAQKSMNAWDALVELRARQLTGAGMPVEEAIREARTLGYSPGDSPQMMQQKIHRLREAADRGMALSGGAGAQVSQPPASPGSAAAPAPAAPPAERVPPPEVVHTKRWLKSPAAAANPRLRDEAIKNLTAEGWWP